MSEYLSGAYWRASIPTSSGSRSLTLVTIQSDGFWAAVSRATTAPCSTVLPEGRSRSRGPGSGFHDDSPAKSPDRNQAFRPVPIEFDARTGLRTTVHLDGLNGRHARGAGRALPVGDPNAVARPQMTALESGAELHRLRFVLLLVEQHPARAVRLPPRRAADGRHVPLPVAVLLDQAVVNDQLDSGSVPVLRVLPGDGHRRVALLPAQALVLELAVDHVRVADETCQVAVAVDHETEAALAPHRARAAARQHPVDHLAGLFAADNRAVEPPSRLLPAAGSRHELVALLRQDEELAPGGLCRRLHPGDAAEAGAAVREQVVRRSTPGCRSRPGPCLDRSTSARRWRRACSSSGEGSTLLPAAP